MIEKPILFSAPMVRAILENRKTQTRRVMKQQPSGGDRWRDISPPYAVGQKMWVRETWWEIPEPTERQLRDGADTWPKVAYNADENDITREQNKEMGWRLRPSIFMPRWASRITLEVTGVRAERLNDISEEDAKAEGVEPLFSRDEINNPSYRRELDMDPMPYKNYLWNGLVWNGLVGRDITQAQSDAWPYQFSSYQTAKGSFESLWESINGKRPGCAWEDNPWVWAYTFKRLER